MIWSILSVATSNCIWMLSTYWCRPGSEAGSQLGFLTSVKDFSGVYWSNMYGPVDSGCRAYFDGALAAPGGIGPMAGKAPQYGMSGNGLAILMVRFWPLMTMPL